jgi:hypothetical protein
MLSVGLEFPLHLYVHLVRFGFYMRKVQSLKLHRAVRRPTASKCLYVGQSVPSGSDPSEPVAGPIAGEKVYLVAEKYYSLAMLTSATIFQNDRVPGSLIAKVDTPLQTVSSVNLFASFHEAVPDLARYKSSVAQIQHTTTILSK